jgi:tRNA 2-selenouridine synthase
MLQHYDPCYERSTRHNYGQIDSQQTFALTGLDAPALDLAARALRAEG